MAQGGVNAIIHDLPDINMSLSRRMMFDCFCCRSIASISPWSAIILAHLLKNTEMAAVLVVFSAAV